jgi:NADPH:quinone reductase-like Zn-dependent oxidoreductase
MSVQIARLAGARVATTVRPGPKMDARDDVATRVRAWTRTDGADVVLDTVGGKTFTACFWLTRPYGDLVTNVESRWEDTAISAMHDRNLRVSFTWMPARRYSAGNRTGSASGRSSSRRRRTLTRASSGSTSARLSRWNARRTLIARWKQGRLWANWCSR